MKIQDLRLALTATPKKTDIRYYLNGVNITKDTVSASNELCLVGYKAMYKVYYWQNCPIVGAYLTSMLFDYLDTATRFALEHDSIVEFTY